MQMQVCGGHRTTEGATMGMISPLPKQSHRCSQPLQFKTSRFCFPLDPLLSPQLLPPPV